MKIGNTDFGHGIFLAPMAGITDHAFRSVCKKYGASCVCTELISAKGVVYGDKKTDTLAKLYDDERKAAIQIFGSDPKIMAEAAKKLMKFSPDFIDINMGCPVTKIVKNGEGSALMRDPSLCERIVYAVSEAVNIPVTVKIRKSCDDSGPDAVEIAKACEKGGAKAVFVHGRTRQQMYSGKADREIIKRVKDSVSVPVIANGDVTDFDSYTSMLEETSADGVMIGRGAYGKPWVFKEILCAVEGKEYIPPSNEEKRNVLMFQLDTVIKEKGEKAICEMRHHLLKYCRGFSGSASLRNEISTVSDRETAIKIIKTIFPL